VSLRPAGKNRNRERRKKEEKFMQIFKNNRDVEKDSSFALFVMKELVRETRATRKEEEEKMERGEDNEHTFLFLLLASAHAIVLGAEMIMWRLR
jgi:hypothetical protein